jgi:NADP-dependent 3-hydroxy acid dehydrogenase YdfG
MTSMNEKVVAITGASSGIGEATAILLAERGAALVLGARRMDRLEAVAARIAETGGRVEIVETDVREAADLHALIAVATDRFGRLDALISNAGVGPVAPLDDLHVTDWEAMVDINIRGLLHGIAAALPVFRRQRYGHFLTTGSTAAYKTVAGQTVYSGTKFAQRAIMEGLRQEAGPNLRVSMVSPGFTDTDFTSSVPNPELRAQLAATRAQIAIPPSAIARAFLFAIEQPDDVDVNEIVVRPTAQG